MNYPLTAFFSASVLMAAMATTTATSQAGDLLLVKNGEARCTMVLGSKSTAAERNICKVLQARIRKRTGCEVAIVEEKGASGKIPNSGVVVVVGAPSGNALSQQLCNESGRLVPTPESVGPGGFVIHTMDHDGKTWVLLAGSDTRGTSCAVGKFLRNIDFSDHDATVGRLKIIDKIDSAEVMDSLQFKPCQWGNPFMDAPIEQIREYTEDMALWGSSSMWNICCYMINNPFKKNADARSKEKWERVRDLFGYAHSLGLEIGYVDCPDCVYDDQLYLRNLGGKPWRAAHTSIVCPSIPEARKVLLENRENVYRAAKEAGIEFKYLLHFAHDWGGCRCDKCKPWIKTFIKLSEDLYRIAVKYHPDVKVYFTTWQCSGLEKRMMVDYLRNEKPKWVKGIVDSPGLKLPDPYVSVGWQTIFAYGPGLSYGKKGANPLPLFLPPKIQAQHKHGIRAVFTYSEGIYDDINTAIVAQVCRRPFRTDIRDILEEYCHYNFGASEEDSIALADLMFTKFKGTKRDSIRPTMRVEAPDEVLAAMEKIEKRMSAWGRDGWRWGILKTRVQLEELDQRALARNGWPRQFGAILAEAIAKDDDAALVDALARAKTYLAELDVSFKEMKKECNRLTHHLYVDLYGTPNRSPAHGSFRLRLQKRNFVPALIKQCDSLEKEQDTVKRREGVIALLQTLKK